MKVTTYNGVDIYVNKDGIFYCTPETNSPDEYYATFKSDSLSKIQKAIDSLNTDFDPYEVYRIYDGIITKVNITAAVGSRLFIGGIPIDQLGGNFFSPDIENTDEWTRLVEMADQYVARGRILEEVSKDRRRISGEIVNLIQTMPTL